MLLFLSQKKNLPKNTDICLPRIYYNADEHSNLSQTPENNKP